jgi:hypothetical protein
MSNAVVNDNGLGVVAVLAVFALVVGFDKLAAWNRARRRKRNGANSPQ